MARAYNVVDADGHILEPLDLWDNYIDPEFRERRPRFVTDENGKERLSVEERLGPLSPEAKHQVLAGGALGFYGLS